MVRVIASNSAVSCFQNDQAGTLAEYMKKHGLSLKKKNQRKQRGKVAKKNVQKKEQKKKEVKKKP